MLLSQPACRLLCDFFQLLFSIAVHAVQTDKVLRFLRGRGQDQVSSVAILVGALVGVISDGAASARQVVLQTLHIVERLLSVVGCNGRLRVEEVLVAVVWGVRVVLLQQVERHGGGHEGALLLLEPAALPMAVAP